MPQEHANLYACKNQEISALGPVQMKGLVGFFRGFVGRLPLKQNARTNKRRSDHTVFWFNVFFAAAPRILLNGTLIAHSCGGRNDLPWLRASSSG
jgi:hypothetical protein